MIPMVNLARQYQSIRREIDAAVGRVLRSGRYVLGEEVERFEEEFATYCGVKYAVGVASGTDALELALRAKGIGPGDKVIVPAFTFVSTAEAVVNVGATPVFCDVREDTFTIDPVDVVKIMEEESGVRAIIPVHLYGLMADTATIMRVAQVVQGDVAVIEDVAQAVGAEEGGYRAGSFGDAGCFSFFPTKILGAAGDGGMVVTDDADVAAAVRTLRQHGANPKYHHELLGRNSRLDEIQAAILRVKLRHLDDWLRKRREIAAEYDRRLAYVAGIIPPYLPPGKSHSYYMYTLICGGRLRRAAFIEHLASRGVEARVYYPEPLHSQPVFARNKRVCPTATALSKEVVSIPLYPELRRAEQERVINAIRTFRK